MSDEAWALTTPPGYGDVATRMMELEAKQQFDDAIQLGLGSLKGQAGDYFVYQLVAQAYGILEYRDPGQSGKWAILSAQYSDKAMDANPADLSNVFNAGDNYALAGDNLPTSESCRYYEKAASIFQALAPRLQGSRATIQGQSFRLAPFRRENAERLADVKRKLASCKDRVPTDDPHAGPGVAKAATQMTEFATRGDYDRAIQTGLSALKQSHDASLYQQLAMVYLMRAYKEPGRREEWARETVLYSEKSLAADVQAKDFLNLHEAGRIMEAAGNISATSKCEYYGKAAKAFSDQAPLLQGESINAYGYRRPLAPIRNENEKSLARVQQELAAAGCSK